MRKLTLITALALSALWGGCRSQSPGPAPAEAKAPDLVVSSPKETTPTAAEALGILPEDLGVPVGTQVPDFTLTTAEGKAVSLGSLVAQRPTLVFFYRGGWCPYCNFQVREFQLHHELFENVGVGIAAISVDTQNGALAAKRAYEISYPVLSDPDLAAHKAFNVSLELDAATRTLYKGYGIDLEAWSGKDHHTIAVPSMFLVDSTRTVRWAHADMDYKTRPSALAVLGAVKTWFKALPQE
ncbi:MAG: AhpC/TSA family protein [Chrysiogenetes bacterium]|nr:AhpC/TSA family protein [Chrysiogenetes bacterium]